ncbi:Uncharacterized protein GBIM_14504 [Gryllus bimaculatus]|nr:Uncharacterized protein GBIM_14504 [Gryllus bimaculatus]
MPTPSELNPEENQLAGAESQVNEVRADENGYAVDQDAAASGGNDAPDPAIAIDDENADDADRNKRQFSFGASGGSGGGSGNFLFDIIRLVSGGSSGGGAASEASTDGTGASGAEKEDGYGAGIPGPVTRLFIIANRGIANLIQDLILRIAQTSERLVNFKARLITSII